MAEVNSRSFDFIPMQPADNSIVEETENRMLISEQFMLAMGQIRGGLAAGEAPLLMKGATGSRFFVDATGERVGIFKGSESVKTLKRSGEIALKSLLGVARPTDYLAGKDERSKAYAEDMAYYLSQRLEFGMVPETHFVQIEGQEGTLQLVVPEGDIEAKKAFADGHSIKIDSAGLLLFQKFAVLDYLMGNLDRKMANWMVGVDENGHIVSIDLIDNGNSFPVAHPKEEDSRIRKNQYQWGTLPFSKLVLTSEIRDIIKRISQKELVQIFNEKKELQKADPFSETFFCHDMIKNCLTRLRVLRKLADIPDATLSMLSELKSDKEIERFLKGKSEL